MTYKSFRRCDGATSPYSTVRVRVDRTNPATAESDGSADVRTVEYPRGPLSGQRRCPVSAGVDFCSAGVECSPVPFASPGGRGAAPLTPSTPSHCFRAAPRPLPPPYQSHSGGRASRRVHSPLGSVKDESGGAPEILHCLRRKEEAKSGTGGRGGRRQGVWLRSKTGARQQHRVVGGEETRDGGNEPFGDSRRGETLRPFAFLFPFPFPANALLNPSVAKLK